MANGYSLIGADKTTGDLPPLVRARVLQLTAAQWDEKLQQALADGTIGQGGSTPVDPTPGSGGYDGGDLGSATTPGAAGGYDGGSL